MSSNDEPKVLMAALVLALALYLVAWCVAGSPFGRIAPKPVTGLPIAADQPFSGPIKTPTVWR